MSADSLRYATLTLSGAVQLPVFDRFDRSPSVRVEATRYLGPVENGEYVGLSDLRGDLGVARDLLADGDGVLRYDVAGAAGHGIVYAHYRSVGPVGDLLAILYRNDIVLDWPIEHRRTEAGSEIRFTVIGTGAGIRRSAAAVPDAVGLSVEQVGRFESRTESAPLLTDRQAALLELAVEEGYYEVPRETTHRALADRLGVAAGTVSDRLQRIERRVMTAYADGPDR
ncbi:helix-turn-helix domain-containing protein [Halogeometricum sp. S1BR25-6]|uniref:Helix-turn-helix domain-containing protein n=1 Tax=Halogeometricum salsisoli TaxID=2950536 RepID=A0ABU2GA42_9EURY|nr:helix-turn-helix domain-containing protein [Halogeometricum sp. S1BR25-6]MDS0297671.1 helix-turn-helix domain-containing protein [Halogeometricum sp. S1BR25-6]